ncbi:hypothetical protein OIU34_17445 [Pararhizobium sp. BT-229]|uniref:hypothetical protein n=1 Tax=Pararhizobium sp. BT-229 TaxID=2986923 RepID=UPI0021F6DE17|nr:hypothetical protein [Pararhizobium sp. BT-229]MCV9963688.1 hypothetical protein [Pararhizobium sp. BT-229]
MSSCDQTYDPERAVYLRIGDWHPSEVSRNYSTGDTEAGVSVYELAADGSIAVPTEGEWSAMDLSDRLKLDLPRHLVQGDWVGCGGEGEPLLQRLVQIGLWPRDLPEGFRSSIVDFEGLTLVAIEDAPLPSGAEAEDHRF